MSRANPSLNSSAVDKQKKHIDEHMNLYSAAAMAAGVSMLALAQPAEGSVVITHVNIPVPTVSSHGLANSAFVPIDINADGVNDFSFENYYFTYHSFHHTIRVVPLTGGRAVVTGKSLFYGTAAALPWGQRIGPSANFSAAGVDNIEGSFYNGNFGNWGGNKTAAQYLGVRFPINGQIHYGWVRLEITTPFVTGKIVAFAYETVPNRPIKAGALKGQAAAEPVPAPSHMNVPSQRMQGPSLGMLALGTDGLAIWRRKEELAN